MLPMINKYNIKTMYSIQGKSLREIAEKLDILLELLKNMP